MNEIAERAVHQMSEALVDAHGNVACSRVRLYEATSRPSPALASLSLLAVSPYTHDAAQADGDAEPDPLTAGLVRDLGLGTGPPRFRAFQATPHAFGLAGTLEDDDAFLMIVECKIPVGIDTVRLFEPIAISLKLALRSRTRPRGGGAR
jgi:hypothetical protein